VVGRSKRGFLILVARLKKGLSLIPAVTRFRVKGGDFQFLLKLSARLNFQSFLKVSYTQNLLYVLNLSIGLNLCTTWTNYVPGLTRDLYISSFVLY